LSRRSGSHRPSSRRPAPRRNSAQLGPPRRGARPNRWARRIERNEVAETVTPILRYSRRSADSPTGVLPSQPHDERDDVPRQAATVTPSDPRVCPASPHQLPMPAQQRRRRDQEDPPTLPRHELGQGSEDQPVGGGVAGPHNLPAQTPITWWRSTAISTSLASGAGPSPIRPRTRRTIKNPNMRATTVPILPAQHPA